jgi:hypothetical protein
LITVTGKKKKTPAGQDTVAIEQGGRSRVLRAWDHGLLPHELVHAAVEAAFPIDGFIRVVARGVAPSEIEGRDAPPYAHVSEALVGAYQYELWGLAPRDDAEVARRAADMCERLAVPAPDLSPAAIQRGRTLLEELAARWGALPPGGKLVVTLPG